MQALEEIRIVEIEDPKGLIPAMEDVLSDITEQYEDCTDLAAKMELGRKVLELGIVLDNMREDPDSWDRRTVVERRAKYEITEVDRSWIRKTLDHIYDNRGKYSFVLGAAVVILGSLALYKASGEMDQDQDIVSSL
jgi:hypothetical protein